MVDRQIAALPKNQKEELRISLAEYQGHDLVQLRVFFRPDDGDMRPGKQGLAIRVAMLPALVNALIDAQAEAVAAGLLPKGGAQ